jgi:hypothetical protein
MRNRTFVIVGAVLTCGLLVGYLAARLNSPTLTEKPAPAGPENRSLRLSLRVMPRKETGEYGFNVRLVLSNVGEKAVVLVPLAEDRLLFSVLKEKTFTGYLKQRVFFRTFPETQAEAVQMPGEELPPLRARLEPGSELVMEWRSAPGHLTEGPSEASRGRFPVPGLYTLRAEMLLESEVEGLFWVISNPVQVSVGGSTELPRSTLGRVRSVFLDENVATINLGDLQGVRKGDVFRVDVSKMPSWRLQVVSSNRLGSRCKILPPPGLDEDVRKAAEHFFLGRSHSVRLILPKTTGSR